MDCYTFVNVTWGVIFIAILLSIVVVMVTIFWPYFAILSFNIFSYILYIHVSILLIQFNLSSSLQQQR